MRRAAVAGTLALLALPAPALAVGPYDFDDDGRQAAVAGAPGWSPGGAPNAGAVFLVDGGDRTLLMEGLGGFPGVPEGDDALGSWTASADFDGDGHADLAVAAPGDRATLVVPGSPDGLRQSAAYAVGTAGPLAAGDLDRDGRAELLIGEPGSDYNDESGGSGRIHVYSGGPSGVAPAPIRTLGRPRGSNLAFGAALAIGDVDGDGHLDVVEGAQGELDWTDGGIPGHASYCRGGPSGPASCRSLGAPLPAGPTTLVVADLDGDRRGDIVAGRPVDAIYEGSSEAPGSVRVWRGSARGPRSRPLTIKQGRRGVPGHNERNDAFGASLAAGDLDGDGDAELVVGAPGEDGGRGRVTIVQGGRGGLATAGHRTLRSRRGGFGAAVALLQLDGDRRPDLAVGAAGERSVILLRGGRRGGFTPFETVTATGFGVPTPPEPPDAMTGFGALLGG